MADEKCHDPFETHASLLFRLNGQAEGRDAAWERFCKIYSPIIAGFARRMGLKTQDISDLVQDVLTGFYERSSDFVYDASRGSFRGFLKTCTWRRLKSKSRKKRIQLDGRAIEEIDDAAVAVDDIWNDVWEREKLQRALALVRERYQARPERAATFRAFEMVVVLGRSVEDVAYELKMSSNSVHAAKSRISKAVAEQFKMLDEVTG